MNSSWISLRTSDNKDTNISIIQPNSISFILILAGTHSWSDNTPNIIRIHVCFERTGCYLWNRLYWNENTMHRTRYNNIHIEIRKIRSFRFIMIPIHKSVILHRIRTIYNHLRLLHTPDEPSRDKTRNHEDTNEHKLKCTDERAYDLFTRSLRLL